MNIREATRDDFDQIWPFFHEIVAAGETYAYPHDITKEQALAIWIEVPRKTLQMAGRIEPSIIPASRWDLDLFGLPFPALKCRALSRCPFGAWVGKAHPSTHYFPPRLFR